MKTTFELQNIGIGDFHNFIHLQAVQKLFHMKSETPFNIFVFLDRWTDMGGSDR